MSNLIIENNELSFNNTLQLDPNNDASGSKIVGSQSGTYFVIWRSNHIHDNYGQGIWSDGNVHSSTYEKNLIENNWGPGIFHEISWDVTINENTLRNNNRFQLNLGKSCWHGAQVVANNSQNMTITSNTVEAIGTNALCLANTTRGAGSVFPQALANIRVSSNIIKLRGDVSVGVVGDTWPSDISFNENTYYIDGLDNRSFDYTGQTDWEGWRSAGQVGQGQLISW